MVNNTTAKKVALCVSNLNNPHLCFMLLDVCASMWMARSQKYSDQPLPILLSKLTSILTSVLQQLEFMRELVEDKRRPYLFHWSWTAGKTEKIKYSLETGGHAIAFGITNSPSLPVKA